MDDDALLRYSRHLLLNEIGIDGQRRIRAARALVVGAGGLGSPAAMYLAAAGIGRLVLADGDRVDLTNLQRQILHTPARIGQPKATSGAATLAALNPEVEVVPLTQRLDEAALREQVAQADVVLDCTDNFATRHAINRACVALRRPLVSGAAIRFDGQLAVFDPRSADSPCYACVFPEGDGEDEACAVMGVFAPLTGIVGTLQAAEALKLVAGADGPIGSPAHARFLVIDALAGSFRSLRTVRDAGCPVCGPAHGGAAPSGPRFPHAP